MIDWSNIIAADETLIWQGRPAPRCFTFRRWRSALFGVLLLLLCGWWQYTGCNLMRGGGSVVWALLPLPFVAFSGYLAFGQLVLARLEWERVFYALTSKQIIVQCGIRKTRVIRLPGDKLNYQCLYPLGEHLGNLYLEAGKRRMTLCCIEYPRELYECLQVIIENNNSLH